MIAFTAIFLYFDQNNEFHYSDYNWPPIRPILGHVKLVSTAEYLLDIIKDIVEEDACVKIPRSARYVLLVSLIKLIKHFNE